MNRREFFRRTAILMGGVTSVGLSEALWADVSGAQPIKSVLSSTQKKQVSVLSELIIPTTDTPGAIAAEVPEFIDLVASSWYKPKELAIFKEGLTGLDKYCKAHFGTAFLQSSEEQQILSLEDAEEQAASYKVELDPIAAMMNAVDENTPFFRKLKEVVVIGYYTSEIGCKEELIYDPMPMRYDGDADLPESGRQSVS